jgi:hypothetical protein
MQQGKRHGILNVGVVKMKHLVLGAKQRTTEIEHAGKYLKAAFSSLQLV